MFEVGDYVTPIWGYKAPSPMQIVGLAEKSGKQIGWVAFYDDTADYPVLNDGTGRRVIGIELSRLRKLDGTN
jgi:hypothetical protein